MFNGIAISDSRLVPIFEAVEAGRALTESEGVALFGTTDLLALGAMADRVRAARHGRQVTFHMASDGAEPPMLEAGDDTAARKISRFAAWREMDGLISVVPVAANPVADGAIELGSGFEDMKSVAVARLFLRVPHVSAHRGLMTPRVAQIALRFGASDLEAASRNLLESGEARRRECVRLIEEAGFEAVERNSRFEVR
ncbi:MAG: hypothetical protein FJW40_08625 [Acidobacteria bacterium]|nr:hypothetical protein [Acidobacteriota bacterium]